MIHPDINLGTDQSLKETFKDVLFYVGFGFFLVGIIALITNEIISLENSINSILGDRNSVIRTFLVVVLLGPVIEESIFRLPLRFKPINLAIATTVLSWVFIGSLNAIYGNKECIVFQILCVLIAMPIGVLTLYIGKKYSEKLKIFWTNNFRFIFYASFVLFGLFHAANFDITSKNIIYLPIIILPWFIAGHINGFIRVKYGFIIGILYHVLNNLVLVLLSY